LAVYAPQSAPQKHPENVKKAVQKSGFRQDMPAGKEIMPFI